MKTAFIDNGAGLFGALCDVMEKPLWWQEKGLTYTATGYGSRIPSRYMVHFHGKWRRVYLCIFSNIGTCFIGASVAKGHIVNFNE